MLHYYRLILPWLLALALPTSAQIIDPAYRADVLRYSNVASLAVLPSGQLLVLGDHLYTNGTLTGSLVRLAPGGAFDAQFTQQATPVDCGTVNVGSPYRPLVRAYPDGRLLLVGSATAQASYGVLRLLANGQLDPSFILSPNILLPNIRTVALQPDGKILLAGTPNSYAQTPCLMRLNPDGSSDPTFLAAMSSAPTDYVQALAVQPDGRILVAGHFSKPGSGLIRLLPSGQPDPDFQPAVGAGGIGEEVLCRPDGRILVAGRSSLVVQGQASALHQLLPNGQLDPAFDPRPAAGYNLVRTADGQRLHLLPGGRLGLLPLAPAPAVVFLQSTGQLDPTRPAINTLPQGLLTAATADSTGGLVLSGQYRHQGGTPGNLLRLRPNGQPDASFAPQLCQLGTVSYLAEQPGLGVVLAGVFDLVNGVASPGLARLVPGSGQVDTAFGRRVPRLDRIAALARHLPGNGLLLSGFSTASGRPWGGVIRLQPGGQLDTLFHHWPSGYTAPSLAVQADGRLLVAGSLGRSLSSQGVARLLSNGNPDPSFTMFTLPYATSINPETRLLVQPDGLILLLSTAQLSSPNALRVLADGRRDLSFNPTSIANYGALIVDDAVVQPDSRITLCGQMPAYNGTVNLNTVLRLLPSGRRDSTLADIFVVPTLRPRALCYQPDGRLLVGGTTYNPAQASGIGLHQYLPDGTPDLTFTEPAGVGNSYSLLRTSSGQVVVGGYFLQANSGNSQHFSLLALAAASALAATPAAAAAATEVYPNPARQQVRVRPAPGRQPRQLRLLDALGRLVLTQPVTAAEPTLDTAALPRGSYLLRIEYAQGSAAVQRLVLE